MKLRKRDDTASKKHKLISSLTLASLYIGPPLQAHYCTYQMESMPFTWWTTQTDRQTESFTHLGISLHWFSTPGTDQMEMTSCRWWNPHIFPDSDTTYSCCYCPTGTRSTNQINRMVHCMTLYYLYANIYNTDHFNLLVSKIANENELLAFAKNLCLISRLI